MLHGDLYGMANELTAKMIMGVTNSRAEINEANLFMRMVLTHWGRVSVGKLTIVGSDYGLSPARRQAITWSNAGIWLIGPLGTNFSEIVIGIQTFSFMKMHLNMSSAKWRSFCLGPN